MPLLSALIGAISMILCYYKSNCLSDQATLHFTLGNVYATAMQFNSSADSYQRAIEIRPKYQAAKGT